MSKPIIAGYLLKAGSVIKSWKKRWFTLTPSKIIYYQEPNGKERGDISLSVIKEVNAFPECSKPNAFRIIAQDRSYELCADNAKQMNEWIAAIKKAKAEAGTTDADTKKEVKVDDFDMLKVLGKGSYGKVQLVRHKGSGQIYAMKSISKQLLSEHDLVSRIIAERDVLLSINHPFLVSARYAFQDETKIFLVLDYVAGGELFSRLRDEQKFAEPRARYYIAELVSAIGYLHSKGIMHRDLKPENILFDKDGYIKLTDFGLVKRNMSKDSTTNTFCGTPEYLAPEMINGNDYTISVDWWAIGTLAYEMLYGVPPFYDANTNAMYRSILRDDVVFPEEASPDAIDLITKLLDKDPETRLGSGPKDWEEIKAHPFFASVNWNDLHNKKIPMQWKPPITNALDVSQFDSEFTGEAPKLTYEDPSLVNDSIQKQLQGFTYTNENQ